MSKKELTATGFNFDWPEFTEEIRLPHENYANLLQIDIYGSALGGAARLARGGELLRRREEAGSAQYRRARGTYAYWYLRRQGYVFVAKNYTPRGIKGELDLIGYDGKTLTFVEVRTRTVKEDAAALPELSVTREKQRIVVRTAQRFLAERHVEEFPLRFDVVAIDNHPGRPPIVRLHKDAFSPQLDRQS